MYCSLKRNSKISYNNIHIENSQIHATKRLLLNHHDLTYAENIFLKILWTKENTKINKRKQVCLFQFKSGIEIKSRIMVTLATS